jgi:hypothetical protein
LTLNIILKDEEEAEEVEIEIDPDIGALFAEQLLVEKDEVVELPDLFNTPLSLP